MCQSWTYLFLPVASHPSVSFHVFCNLKGLCLASKDQPHLGRTGLPEPHGGKYVKNPGILILHFAQSRPITLSSSHEVL